jgi:hypothetical protein
LPVARLGLWDRAFAFVALDETDRQIVWNLSIDKIDI